MLQAFVRPDSIIRYLSRALCFRCCCCRCPRLEKQELFFSLYRSKKTCDNSSPKVTHTSNFKRFIVYSRPTLRNISIPRLLQYTLTFLLCSYRVYIVCLYRSLCSSPDFPATLTGPLFSKSFDARVCSSLEVTRVATAVPRFIYCRAVCAFRVIYQNKCSNVCLENGDVVIDIRLFNTTASITINFEGQFNG